MPRLTYNTTIAASPARVWDVMLEQETYQSWTSAFAEGSRYEGSWDQGQSIRFLGPDGNGMVAVIAENRRHEFLSIQHLGMIMNGVQDTESELAKAWTPSFENYRFTPAGSSTELEVTLDVPEQYVDFMNQAWSAALAKLKGLCEAPGPA